MKRIVCLLVFTILLAVAGCRKEAPAPREGEPAPDFTLAGISGEKVRLSDLRGKAVLLNFWATWCSYCREEIPSLVTLNAAMAGKNFRMLTVANDTGGRDDVTRFFGKTGVSLPTLLDPQGSAGKSYGITGFPETFVIDKKGIIRKKVIGPINWSDPDMIRYLDGLAAE